MALVAHTIYAPYTPPLKSNKEYEFQDLEDEEADSVPVDFHAPVQTKEALEDAAWKTESSFPTMSNRLRPPVFVPASRTSLPGSLGFVSGLEGAEVKGKEREEEDVAGWYGAITGRTGTPNSDLPEKASRPVVPHSTPATASSSRRSTPPISRATAAAPVPREGRPNWFSSAPSPSTSQSITRQSDSLADILSREPPPRRDEPKFTPPVFLELNPGNKGWRMLEKWGWREGEGVGHGGAGASTSTSGGTASAVTAISAISRARERDTVEVIDLTDDNVPDPGMIDLTLSDSDSDSDAAGEDDELESIINSTIPQSSSSPSLSNTHTHSHDTRTTLLTPLPTILKADRFGIGLKARTQPASSVGGAFTSNSNSGSSAASSSSSYRVPIKKITPTLARHLHLLELARKRKERFGRGKRGFARAAKGEARERKELLAYLNS